MKTISITAIILAVLLCGCSGLTQKTESLKKTETSEIKLQSMDTGKNSYSGDPVDNVAVSASGNSTINLTITPPEKKKISKNEQRSTTIDEEASSSFSVDYYLRSVPLTGWILILVLVVVLAVCGYIYLKTTIAGKALDASVGSGLKLTRKAIDRVRDKLAQADKGTDMHTEMLEELAKLRKQEGDFLLKKKYNPKEDA